MRNKDSEYDGGSYGGRVSVPEPYADLIVFTRTTPKYLCINHAFNMKAS